MKRILLTLVLPLLITTGLAPRAEAGRCYGGSSTYISGRTHCGCPIYSQRYVAYYTRCGQPVFQVRVLPVNHQCRSRHYQPYRHGHGHGCAAVVQPPTCGVRPNHQLHSPLPVPPLPRVDFPPGHSIHVGFGLR